MGHHTTNNALINTSFTRSDMAPTADPFFPEIRDAAERTDQLPEVGEDVAATQGAVDAAGEEEDRPVQEVESLCMSCGEQVS